MQLRAHGLKTVVLQYLLSKTANIAVTLQPDNPCAGLRTFSGAWCCGADGGVLPELGPCYIMHIMHVRAGVPVLRVDFANGPGYTLDMLGEVGKRPGR